MDIVLDLQIVSTLMLCGLIWTVQLVHYPAFRFANVDGFERFHRFHSRRISMIVGVLMPVELVTAAILVWTGPDALTLTGFGLVFLIWASTAFLQVPPHRRLSWGYEAEAHEKLVRTNWIRTAAWSVRAALVVAMC